MGERLTNLLEIQSPAAFKEVTTALYSDINSPHLKASPQNGDEGQGSGRRF